MKNQSTVLKQTKEAFLHFLFPAHCFHCREEEVGARELLCLYCKEFLERLPLSECETHRAAAVQKEGAATSLLMGVNGFAKVEIAKTMAALMALQIIDLKWPSFDGIIPFSEDPFNGLVAKELSSFLSIPIKKIKKLFSDQTLLVVDYTLTSSSPWHLLEETAPKEVFWVGFC